jgi:hypothetical protein
MYYGMFIRASTPDALDDLQEFELEADLVSLLRHYHLEPARNHQGDFVLIGDIPSNEVEVL